MVASVSVATSTGGPGDTGDGASVLVIAEARGRTERALVRHWVDEQYPGARLAPADDPAAVGAALVASGPSTPVVPVRVVWPPAERDGADASRWSDVLSLSARRRGLRHLHARVSGWSGERGRVVDGEPATVGDLRERCAEEVGPRGSGAGEFTAFVRRRATLACDRAERRLTGDRYKVPRLMAEQITSSARVAARAEELADELGLTVDDVLEKTAACLTEMAAVQSPPAIDVFRTVMGPLHTHAWDVEVDHDGLARLRELGRTRPLVFLPSHRSYADPLVLAEVLHAHDFPRNHVLGGDNLSFWPIGSLGKRAGIVFIRRSFGDDKIYKFAVREYFGHLLAKRFNLEWYVEGGRTRTGKLRPPKYGLLHYLVEATRALSDVPEADPVLVPVSIQYDQLHEVSALAAEQGGAGKKAEGLLWLARYVRDQRRRIGTARVRFGEPFSLREGLEEAGEGPSRLEKVAFRICTGINAATPVTPTSLATFALLGAGDRALTFGQVRDVVAPMLEQFARRGVPVGELDHDDGLARTLTRLEGVGVVERHADGPETVWSIGSDRHHVAAFYRNGALHHLLVRAVVETALVAQVADPTAPGGVTEACWEESLRLRDQLKFEFFFSRKRVFTDELVAELEMLDPDWDRTLETPGGAAALLARCRVLVAPRTLRPFVDAQLVVATALADRPATAGDPSEGDERTAFLDACVGLGRQWWLQRRIRGADTVSRELFGTALRAAGNRGLLTPGPGDSGDTGGSADLDDLAARRRAWRDEIALVRDRLVLAAERERDLLEEVLGADRRG